MPLLASGARLPCLALSPFLHLQSQCSICNSLSTLLSIFLSASGVVSLPILVLLPPSLKDPCGYIVLGSPHNLNSTPHLWVLSLIVPLKFLLPCKRLYSWVWGNGTMTSWGGQLFFCQYKPFLYCLIEFVPSLA